MMLDKNYKTILLVEKDNYLEIILNRPEVHNALNALMIEELTNVFLKITKEQTFPIAVVLRGKGKSFCAGADLNYMKNIASYGYDENVKDGEKLANLFSSIYKCPFPTIACVHGVAYGGANGLLAACDIVVAEKSTRFSFSEVKLGIAPATIAPFVLKRIGEYGAKELMLTGKQFYAAEAARWHLVNIIAEDGSLDAERDKFLKDLKKGAPGAKRQTKELIHHIVNKENIEEDIFYTSDLIAKLRASEEGQEGMAAFLDKRVPKWIKND